MPSLEDKLDVNPAKGVVRSLTPTGIEIYFQSEPERLYKVNGRRAPGVTDVLSVLKKDSLPWWGMTIGVKGVQTLLRDHPFDQESVVSRTPEELVENLKEYKLTIHHARDKAGVRGVAVHSVLEEWSKSRHRPDPEEFHEEDRGYVKGLLAFLDATKGRFVPIASEVMVASDEFGYAGRFDEFAETEGFELQTGPRRKRVIPEGRGIWDLKTSKGIYKEHHYQTAGYRLAYEESHGIRSDYEAILNVREDGTYDVGFSEKKPHHFLAIKQAWEATK
jgi:hypothetical protein